MKSFDKVLEKSLKKGVHESLDSLQLIIDSALSQIPYSSSSFFDDTGCRWIEVFDKEKRLCCLFHRYYKIAFVLDRINVKLDDVYCVYVKSFSANEWHIEDLTELNKQYIYLHWDEPEEVVDPNRFNILDMEFATE